MKAILRKICSPILNLFEKGPQPEIYKPLNRKILFVMAVLLIGLATGVTFAAVSAGQVAFFLPVIVFGGGGLVCLIVGALGDERAVMNIWGGR
ncbi:hypothetical protein C2869_14400 [Saccharobesus litoralis]|uniref:Uncharacterized protein n=1 Tax=Saccharobesus litoralis TaxID=2172099 RepID=A0A2S0VTL0_9ALTE|nr:hypothetical protein [Saccharobesus litoralis]AWB67556.1 hypothetical protein C2869_14400 [Saccharobesus litoralis]